MMMMVRRASPRFQKDVNKDKEAELQRLEDRVLDVGAPVYAEAEVGGGTVDVEVEEAGGGRGGGGEALVVVESDAALEGVRGVVVQGAAQRREQLESKKFGKGCCRGSAEINKLLPRIGIGLNYILRRKGPMSLGASQVAVFAKSIQGLETPDIQFHFQPLSADKPGIEMHPFSGITSSVCQLRPESRGHIHIHSPRAAVYPKIVPNYLSAPADQHCAVRAVKFARAMTQTEALKPFIVREHVPNTDPQSDEQLLDCARNISQTIYHPTSTCRMGQDSQAVVDDRLRVKGIRGLRVADASVMPAITSGNTNAPTIMIAEKASDMILEDRR